MLSPRARLQPLDVSLRHAKTYTRIRRMCLGISVLITFGVPYWHLTQLGESPPPLLGPVGAINLFGIELLDPMAMVSVLLSAGPSWKWAWAALPAVAVTALLGRFFCGWVCPYVPLLAATHAARWLLTRVGLRPLDLQLPRRTSYGVLVAVLLAPALVGTQIWPLLYPPSVIGREAFHVVFFGGLTSGILLLVFALAFDTFVSRAGFCRSLCPGGAAFSLCSVPSVVTLKLDTQKCTRCTACNVVCNLGQQPMDAGFDEGCERCGKCVASCPHDALAWGLRRRP